MITAALVIVAVVVIGYVWFEERKPPRSSHYVDEWYDKRWKGK
jgi:hypothetical protein